jgi:hypothetical protein
MPITGKILWRITTLMKPFEEPPMNVEEIVGAHHDFMSILARFWVMLRTWPTGSLLPFSRLAHDARPYSQPAGSIKG